MAEIVEIPFIVIDGKYTLSALQCAENPEIETFIKNFAHLFDWCQTINCVALKPAPFKLDLFDPPPPPPTRPTPCVDHDLPHYQPEPGPNIETIMDRVDRERDHARPGYGP